jgi:hypothetical protein
MQFNKIHASTRVDVERTIGLLKGKWRRLKYLDMLLISEMLDVVMACCVLHNFVLKNSVADEDDDYVNNCAGDDDQQWSDGCDQTVTNNADAEAKRHNIACALV